MKLRGLQDYEVSEHNQKGENVFSFERSVLELAIYSRQTERCGLVQVSGCSESSSSFQKSLQSDTQWLRESKNELTAFLRHKLWKQALSAS